MKLLVIALCVVIAMVVIAVGIGYALPVRHRAVRQATYHQTPATLFGVISDVERFPAWRTSVDRVEIIRHSPGTEAFREIGSDGPILFEVDSVVPNKTLVTRIADPSLPFGGRWTYELLPNGMTTTLRITEDGEVFNPVFRLMSRFVMGHNRTIDRYLTDLGKRFNEPNVHIESGDP